jgi:hypothetical protein
MSLVTISSRSLSSMALFSHECYILKEMEFLLWEIVTLKDAVVCCYLSFCVSSLFCAL